ncbi:hypothetical protein J4E89_001570 [Alternaria sp. Ai002NY15]|nr:hypothetical protein J4E89_001570 [Alternaria sp. Ai002NY15]
MPSLLLSWFLFHALILAFVAGYKIDQSCEDKGITQDIRDAMTSAIEKAAGAYDTLTSPLSDDALELLGFLFAKDGVSPAELMDKGKFGKTIGVLQNINANMWKEVTGTAEVLPEDVVIFCHYDRWKPVEGEKDLYRDSTNGVRLKFREQACRGNTVLDKIALAVTFNPETEVVWKNGRPIAGTGMQPAQIQLCTWFVDWIKQKKFKLSGDVQKRTKIGRAMINAAEWRQFGLRQIDAFSLLDKVLLHEMTHARGAYIEYKDGEIEAEGLIDVTSPERLLGIWKWPAYGWKGTTALARQGDDLGEYAAPDNNADTIALFASGCSLLKDQKKIDAKGRIVPMQ